MRPKLLLVCVAVVVLGLGRVLRARFETQSFVSDLARFADLEDRQPEPLSPVAGHLEPELRAAFEALASLGDGRHWRTGRIPEPLEDFLGGLEVEHDLAAGRDFEQATQPILARLARALGDVEVQAAMARGERLASEPVLLMDARRAANTLCVIALLRALDGEGERATELLGTSLDLAYAMDDRTMVSAMVRVSLEAIVHDQVVRILELGLVDPALLRQRLEPRWKRCADEANHVEMVHREFEGLLAQLAMERAVRAVGADERGPLLEYFQRGERALAIAELGPQAALDALGAAPAGDGLGVWSAGLRVLHAHLARTALLRVAVDAYVFRQEHGSWLGDLSTLKASAPLDPHTGSAFAVTPQERDLRLGPAAYALFEGQDWEQAERQGLALTLR